MRYTDEKENEWIRPIKVNYKMSCCDCGLVHQMDFKIKDKRVWFRVRRDYRATGQVRRHMNTKTK